MTLSLQDTERYARRLAEERRRCAVHEAGHIVAADGFGVQFGGATIQPDDTSGGRTAVMLWSEVAPASRASAPENATAVTVTREQLLGQIAMLLGGPVAEVRHRPTTPWGAALSGTDCERVWATARGITDGEPAAMRCVADVRALVEKEITARWHAVLLIADALEVCTTVDGAVVRALLASAGRSSAA